MKKYFSFLSIAVLIFISGTANKVSATFTPGYTRDSLTGLTYDSLLTLSGATKNTVVQSGTADDGSIFINLPFVFQYNGTNYSRITVSTNGWIAMDSTTATNFTPNLFSNTTAVPINTIGGWFRDANINTANQGMFVHQMKVSGPDTIYVIEYRNFSGAAGGGASATLFFNMQIWLYKTTNKIEMRYGPIVGAITTSAAIGLKDDGTGAAPHFYNALFNNSTTTTLAAAWPSSGNGYRYNPIIPVANDVGTTVILNPVNGGGAGNQAPVATIKNFGSATQSGYSVVCTISPGGYFDTQLAPTLTSGNSTNITFSNVTLAPNIPYTVTVYTSLPGDQNLNNDTQRVVVSLIEANYGSDSGYFYANNLATNQPSYPEYCWKDTTGSRSILVNGVTAPGNTLVGNLDDGYYILSLKDILLSLGQDTTDKHLKYNGVCYDSIFPGSNGIIGFTQQFGVTSLSTFSIDGALVADNALLPIWHDADLATLTNQLTNRVSYLAKANQLIITYDKVASFSPETDWVSYQVVIEIVTGCGASNSNFRFTMADTTGGKTSASFLTNYLAQYPAATGQVTTFRNYVSGYSFTGAPIAYGGYVSTLNPFPASPSTQLNIKRPLFNLTTGQGLAVEFGPNQNILNMHDCLVLCIRMSIQGMQSNPTPRVRDTVEIILRDAVAPYKPFQKFRVLLDSANNGSFSYGYKYLDYSLLKRNYPYFIQIKNRSGIDIWSNPIATNSDTLKYDYTTGIGQTYGSNAILVNGAASMYTGDIAPPDAIRDGCIDLTDILAVFNDATAFTQGPYVLSDLNYDGITDLTDIVLCSNNANNFVCVEPPPGAADFPEINIPEVRFNNAPPVIIADPNAKAKIDFNSEIKEVEIKR